jgi:hypothetical protein
LSLNYSSAITVANIPLINSSPLEINGSDFSTFRVECAVMVFDFLVNYGQI